MAATIAAIMRLIVLYLAHGLTVHIIVIGTLHPLFKGRIKRFQFVMAKSVLVGNSPAPKLKTVQGCITNLFLKIPHINSLNLLYSLKKSVPRHWQDNIKETASHLTTQGG